MKCQNGFSMEIRWNLNCTKLWAKDFSQLWEVELFVMVLALSLDNYISCMCNYISLFAFCFNQNLTRHHFICMKFPSFCLLWGTQLVICDIWVVWWKILVMVHLSLSLATVGTKIQMKSICMEQRLWYPASFKRALLICTLSLLFGKVA